MKEQPHKTNWDLIFVLVLIFAFWIAFSLFAFFADPSNCDPQSTIPLIRCAEGELP